jgi:hypothetical protein
VSCYVWTPVSVEMGLGLPPGQKKERSAQQNSRRQKKSQVNLENTERVMHALKASTQ